MSRRRDVVAGVTTAAVVIPQAMAYAALAGLPVQYGLYVALVPPLAYAALGASRALSVSTTSTVAILTAGAIGSAGPASAEMLALLVGCLLGGAGLFKLGFLGDFISLPILTGFKIGTGLVIASSQLGKVLGVDVTGNDFFEKLYSALTQLGDASATTVALAAATIALLLVLRRVAPRFPGALFAVVLGILAVDLLNLGGHGVALIADVPAGLPGPELPDLSKVGGLVAPAAGIALMCFVESIAAGRAFVRKGDRRLDADRELRALGAANLAGSVFQGFPASGGLSQTAVNDGAGAASPFAGVVVAVVAAVTLLFLTGLFADLADATLGAVVLVAILGLLDTSTVRRIARVRGRDGALALVAIFGVLLLGVLQGVLVAVVISLITLMHGLNRLPIRVLGRDPATGLFESADRHPEAVAVPGLLVLRPEGGLYFANARRVADRVRALAAEAQPEARIVLIDGSAIPDWETTAIDVVEDLDDRLGELGLQLWLAALNDRPLEMLRRTDLEERFAGRLFHSPAEAVERFSPSRPPHPPRRPAARSGSAPGAS
jgi:SulP family sulfate permease